MKCKYSIIPNGSNNTHSVDHALPVLSEIVVNEYLNAGDVHLKYWHNAELSSFILEKIGLISAGDTAQISA